MTVIMLGAIAAGLLALAGTPLLRRLSRSPDALSRDWWHAAAAAAVGGWFGHWLGLVLPLLAFAVLAAVWAIAARIDVAEHHLPNPLTYGSYPVFLLLLLPSAHWDALGRAALAGLVVCIVYFVMAFASPRSFGLGDVKLGLSAGAVLGWFSWRAVALGSAAAFLLFAVVALVLLISRRADRRTDIAFGPFIMMGAVLGPLLA
ncbi:prepilin peptidase [Tessaracoccus sp.]